MIRLNTIKDTIKIRDLYGEYNKTFDQLEVIELGKYWMAVILCSDGTIDCLTNSEGCIQAMCEKRLRDLLNSDYVYQNVNRSN